MSSQNNPIPSLIAEIDSLLQRSSLSWQTVEVLAQQRYLLERVRQVLSQLSDRAPEVDPISMMRAVVQEVEQLRTSLVQPLHTELAYLRQQRDSLLQEIRQLEAQRQVQSNNLPTVYSADLKASLQEMVQAVKTTIQHHRESLLQEVDRLQSLKPQHQSIEDSLPIPPPPLEPSPSVAGLSSSSALSRGQETVSVSPSQPEPLRSLDTAPTEIPTQDRALPEQNAPPQSLFPYAGAEVQGTFKDNSLKGGDRVQQELSSSLSASLERDINSWWLVTSGIGNLTGTEFDLLDAELDLEDLELDNLDLNSIDDDLGEIDYYLESYDELQQEQTPPIVQSLNPFSAANTLDPMQGWEITDIRSETGSTPQEARTEIVADNRPEAEAMVQQIRALTDLLPEPKPSLASGIFAFDESMGSLFSDTPEVISVKPTEPPVSPPHSAAPGDRNLADISTLFVHTPPIATPVSPPGLNSNSSSSQNSVAQVNPPLSTTEKSADEAALSPVSINVEGNTGEISDATLQADELNPTELRHAFESLVGPIGGITLPSKNSRLG